MSDALTSQMFGDRVMLFNELVDGHETTTHSDNQIVILNLHDHLLREVTVMSSLLTIMHLHKQTLHSLLSVTQIDEVC